MIKYNYQEERKLFFTVSKFMVTCEICKNSFEPTEVLKIELGKKAKPESHCSVCFSCFLLTIPMKGYLRDIDEETINNSSNSKLNSYLYNKILNKKHPAEQFDISDNSDSDESLSYYDYDSRSSSSKNNVNNFGYYLDKTNLTPIFGREKELKNIINILTKKNKNNPVIVGPSGVGKTALVRGLAYEISKGNVPKSLKNKRIFVIDISAILAGTKYRGDFESRMNSVLRSFKDDKNTMLFFDEMHTLVSAGETDGNSVTALNILKPFLTDENSVQVIGATTPEEYAKSIERNPAFARRFQKVNIDEPSTDEIYPLLMNLKPEYESYHKLVIPDDSIKECIRLADSYIKYRNFPDKAIDLLDTACSLKKNWTSTEKAETIENIINDCIQKYDISFNIPIFDLLLSDYKNFADFSREIQARVKKMSETETSTLKLEYSDLAQVIENWTNIPVSDLDLKSKKTLIELPTKIKERLIGQNKAVEIVCKAVLRRRLSISETKRPASFIFVGETGVGKTQLAKELAIELFGSADRLIRFDMSEYMEKHSISKLIGAPPGYVGYEESGALTEAIKNNPFCILLFDEIEKAHHDVSNILLQMLDDGILTDSHGCKVSCENAIIIMTSNAGTNTSKGMGFGKSENIINEEAYSQGLKEAFRAEFLGRVDSVIYFNSLSEDNYKLIIKNRISKLEKYIEKKGIEFIYDDSLINYIFNKSDCSKFHAREINRTVVREIEDRIVDLMLTSEKPISKIYFTIIENELMISQTPMITTLCK